MCRNRLLLKPNYILHIGGKSAQSHQQSVMIKQWRFLFFKSQAGWGFHCLFIKVSEEGGGKKVESLRVETNCGASVR